MLGLDHVDDCLLAEFAGSNTKRVSHCNPHTVSETPVAINVMGYICTIRPRDGQILGSRFLLSAAPKSNTSSFLFRWVPWKTPQFRQTPMALQALMGVTERFLGGLPWRCPDAPPGPRGRLPALPWECRRVPPYQAAFQRGFQPF